MSKDLEIRLGWSVPTLTPAAAATSLTALPYALAALEEVEDPRVAFFLAIWRNVREQLPLCTVAVSWET